VGGLFDALHDTKGRMYAVSNREAAGAAALFAESEGIDLSPAAAVAVGSLVQAVEQNTLAPDEIVNLNITGGGYLRARRELDTYELKPDIVAGPDLFSSDRIVDAVRSIQTTHIHLA
jgi:cysteate synthase